MSHNAIIGAYLLYSFWIFSISVYMSWESQTTEGTGLLAMLQLKVLPTLPALEHTRLSNEQAVGKQRSRLLIRRRVLHVVVSLLPKGAYIHTVRVTATLLSRSSRPAGCYGRLLCKGEQQSAVHHGMIQSMMTWCCWPSEAQLRWMWLSSEFRFFFFASLCHWN